MQLSTSRFAAGCLLAVTIGSTTAASAAAAPLHHHHHRHERRHLAQIASLSITPAHIHRHRHTQPGAATATAASVTPTTPAAPAASASNPATASTPSTSSGTTGGSVAQDPTDPFAIGLNATTPGTADPSGMPMPVGNLPGWNQIYTNDFTTNVPVGGFSGCTWNGTVTNSTCTGLPTSLQSQLFAYPDGWSDTQGNGQYEPSQVLSIQNGLLNYNIHTANGIHMVSGVIPKIPGSSDGNGLQTAAYVVRFRADALYGYKTAFLLWPDNYPNGNVTWPSLGEIDFPEGDLDNTFAAYMHDMNATNNTQQDAYPTPDTYTDWHTAVIEKTANMIRFVLDGHIIGTSTQNIPTDPMHWILQVETALDGKTPADTTTGNVQIDWIAAYTPTN